MRRQQLRGVVTMGLAAAMVSAALGQPATGSTGIGQGTVLGQPTIGIGQPPLGIGQPTIGIGQPTIGMGPSTTGIGQPTIGLGQMATNTTGSGATGFGGMAGPGQMGSMKPSAHRGFNGPFLRRVIADAQLQLMLGQLAATNAQSPAVQAYAGTLLARQTAALSDAQGLATSRGVSVPQLTGTQQRFVNSFAKLPANQFDARFVNFVIQSRISAISFLENSAVRSNDAEIRAFARQELPVLMEELVAGLELREQLQLQ